MALNLALASITSTSSTTTRTLGARFSDVINVKDYGAVGDGVTNDTVALQAAFSAAYGTPASPHGDAGKYLNKPVFLPAGNYRTTGPLYLIGVQGGHVYGMMGSTRISFEDPGTGTTVIPRVTVTGAANNGSGLIRLTITSTTGMATSDSKIVGNVGGTIEANGSWTITVIDGTHVDLQGSTFSRTYTSGGFIGAAGSEVTPAIMLNGVANSVIEGITIGGNSYTNSVGIFMYSDGTYLATAVMFKDLVFDLFSTGILGGYGGSGGNCDNCDLHNVFFTRCSLAGLRVVHQNAINWAVFGGGGSNCAFASTFVPGTTPGNGGALYSAIGGAISPICAASMSDNRWDFYAASSSPLTVIGGSSESQGCCVLQGGGGQFSSFAYRNVYSSGIVQALGAITGGSGYVDGNYFDVPLTGGSGSGAKAMITVFGGAVTFVGISTPSGVGGATYAISDALSASNTNLGGSGSGFSVSIINISSIFIDLTFSGLVVVDSCVYSPGNDRGLGAICNMGNNGIAFFNQLNAGSGAAACSFVGTAGSKLSVLLPNLTNITSPFTSFTGQIVDIDIPIGTVSTLTTAYPAAAKFKGIRAMVTDATATTFMSTVAGTGGNTVPVVCDGTNWKIG